MTSNTLKLCGVLKVYKALYGFLIPLLNAITVISAILCCFKPAEGSNSRTICIAIVIFSLAVAIIMRLVNKSLEKRNATYHIYQSRLVKKLEPHNMIPLLLMFVVVVFPFYILVVTSIKTPLEANALHFTWWPKDGYDFESYKELLSFSGAIGISLAKTMWNAFVYAIVPTVIGLFAAAASAYAFAKLPFKRKNTLYNLLIMTMMMPGCVTMTTAYIMYDYYGWTNSPLPLVVPGFFSGAVTVMFLREFFMGIPDQLMEAATIDGAGKWRIFFSLILPLGRPALMAQFVLGFITKYNDFVAPLIYLNDSDDYTIQIALSFLNGAVQDKSLIASAGVFSLVPMLILYVVFQKQIIDGISMSSGLKG